MISAKQAKRFIAARAVERSLPDRLAARLVEGFGWSDAQIAEWFAAREDMPESLAEIDRRRTERCPEFAKRWRPFA